MHDALFSVGENEKSGTFYSVQKYDYDFTLEFNRNMLSATFFIDSTEHYYERKVYNIFDLTGQTGGLYEILTLAGSIFVAFFSENILMLSLISSLYQTEDKKEVCDYPILNQNNITSKVVPIDSKIEEEKDVEEEEKNPNF
jgi:hypothetical protein